LYWIPDQTIAPIAKSAPNCNTLSATFTTISFTPVIPSPPLFGSIAPSVQSAQLLNNSESGVLASNIQLSADAKAKFIEKSEIKQRRKSEVKRIF